MTDSQGAIAVVLGMEQSALVDGIVELYLQEYPESAASTLGGEELASWTREYLDELDATLRGEGVAPLESLWYTGDMVSEASAPFLPLANLVEGKIFVSRAVAAFARRRLAGNPRKEQEFVAKIEEATLSIIRVNMRHYTEHALVPGCLMRDWQSTSPSDRKSDESRVESATSGLSRRELQVLKLAVAGKANGQIAASLGIAQNTVKNHLARVYDKLNVSNRAELVRKAMDLGII